MDKERWNFRFICTPSNRTHSMMVGAQKVGQGDPEVAVYFVIALDIVKIGRHIEYKRTHPNFYAYSIDIVQSPQAVFSAQTQVHLFPGFTYSRRIGGFILGLDLTSGKA